MDKQLKKKAEKRQDTAPLEGIRLVLRAQAVKLQPVVNQVSDLPVDDQLEYYFVPMQFMAEYEHYHRPGKPFKNLKLVNFERPAISLSFFSKHKYVIERQTDPDDVMLHLKTYRDELINRSSVHQLTAGQEKELKQADEILRTLRENPEAYKACFSNYHHYYRYWYCSYRYFEDTFQLQTGSSSEHLLKHTERIEGKLHERLNIIFIDPKYITRPVPNDNKRVDRELETFPIQLRQGVTTLYLRKQ